MFTRTDERGRLKDLEREVRELKRIGPMMHSRGLLAVAILASQQNRRAFNSPK